MAFGIGMRSPLSGFVQPDVTILHDLWHGKAFACHQLTYGIDLMMAHFNLAILTHQPNKMATKDIAAFVFGSQNVSARLVFEYGFGGGVTILCILYRLKYFVVVIDLHIIWISPNIIMPTLTHI